MKEPKNTDEYSKFLEGKSVNELLDILSFEAEKLREMIKSILNKGDKNGKN